MFSNKRIMTSTGNSSDNIKRFHELFQKIDTVIIGAGAGLSTSAGLVYTGERFEKYFGDFASKYHFKDMYSGGFYPYDTLEEHWAYWSRYIYINRYMDAPKPVYRELYDLVKDKDYFEACINRIILTREKTKCQLKELGISFTDSQTNFIFATHATKPAKEIFEALKERHIYVRYFNKPRINNYLRITIGTNEQMEMFIQALREILEVE